MATERWQRVQELFHRAADLGPGERAALLQSECGADGELRAEVERLLRGDGSGDGSGDDAFSRLEAHTRAAAPDPLIGRTLGAWRLTARLAEGGMGVVYRAERADGLFQQEVAVKLIQAERASEWMLRRFEFERRTLAALQHPCIARLYDGGTTADGFPYFVMELVRGEAIDRYCERERLPLAQRLRLFVQVCRAVHYAHQSLVVHCDLKPANILIDERGVPRLLDFGIARLLEDGPDAAAPAATRTIARVLTPEYASPEQLAGGPVTTAIDVYSLGVVLYELATGCRPFQSESRSPADWERLVREQAPERPSTRVSRSADSGLRRALRGDLDRIVLMALRKEPERRYASVQELADDLERQLAGQPVRARENSLSYLASKFIRRNRLAVAAGTAVLGALLFGLFAAQRGERIAEAEAQHARIEADSFQSIAGFLMESFLPAQPAQDAAWQERARLQVLAQAERVDRQYAGSDHMHANLLDTLGQVCLRLDLFDDAERLMREALAIRERAFGRQSLEYALSLRSLGQLKYRSGDYGEAARLLEQALPLHRAAGSETHADVGALANDLAACLRNLGRDGEAEALHREALALRRQQGDGTLPVAESLNNLAGVHLGRGDLSSAVAELREALAIRAAILGEAHLLSLQTTSNLAGALWRQGQREEARSLMQRAEEGYRLLGVDGEDGLGLVLANLATMQLELRDRDGAAASLDEALALQTRRLGADHPLVATTLAKLALLEQARGRQPEARALWEEVVRIRRATEASPRDLAEALYGYGVFLAGSGEREAAREQLQQAARLLEDDPGATADERARPRRALQALDRPAGG